MYSMPVSCTAYSTRNASSNLTNTVNIADNGRSAHFVEIVDGTQTPVQVVDGGQDGERALFEASAVRLKQQPVPRHVEAFLRGLGELRRHEAEQLVDVDVGQCTTDVVHYTTDASLGTVGK